MQKDTFSIQENLNNLALFLDRKDLVECIKVSRHWYDTFLPFIWNSIDFTKDHIPYDSEILRKHAHLVMTITLDWDSPLYAQKTVYPSLHNVFIHSRWPDHEILSDIFHNHPTIKNLFIDRYVALPKDFNLWETMSHYCSLKEVDISHNNPCPNAIPAFWTVLSQLKVATLYSVDLPENLVSDSLTPQKLKNMTRLKLFEGTTPHLNFEIVKRCTELEYLTWTGVCMDDEIIECFSRGTWPNLHNIALYNVKLNDTQIKQILSSITRLTVLNLHSATWGFESFQSLARHFRTLERLIQPRNTFTSEMANTVLCSCPNLIEFYGSSIKGMDIANNNRIVNNEQPCDGWICTQLTSLTLAFDLENMDSQIPVLKNLARLTQLEKLYMDRFRYTQPPVHSLILSLKDGLDMLRSLRRIKIVSFSGESRLITKVDIEWMHANWSQLESLRCRNLCHNMDCCLDLQDYLDELKLGHHNL